MSFFVAAMWSIAARLASDLMMIFLASARPSGQIDLVSVVLCEGVGFMMTLFFLAMVHDRDTPLSDVLGLRRTHVVLCLIALALGVALQGPITLIVNAIYSRYPLAEQDAAAMRELLSPKTAHEKVAFFAGVGVVGPVVEEVFFRGGILRNLRRTHTAGLTLLGTSLLFAAAHLDPQRLDMRNFVPHFLGGLAMGYVRILSGSLWPAILLHAAFNSASALVALYLGPEADALTRPQNVVASLVTLGLVALYGMVAARSARSAEARAEDQS
jgi:membrane protease YdiL (CAAX protease family)